MHVNRLCQVDIINNKIQNINNKVLNRSVHKMRRQTNQNNRFFDRRKPLRANAVTPDIIVGPIWLHDEQPSTIEIIELNSSNEVETSPRERNESNCDNSNENTWAHVNNHGVEPTEDRFKINKKAREKRRMQNENNFTAFASTYASQDANDYNSEFVNNFYTKHSTNHINDELKFNHQMNCFSIFNKRFIESDTDTSTEGEYGEVEIITSSELILDRTNWEPHNNDLYNEDIVTYGTDIDQETRTIWIYSYKNKHSISDDDFEIKNTSKDILSTSTSYSTDSSGENTAENSTSFCRLGSPKPPIYIPRLDLSLVPTLSTVTEISERNAQQTPKGSIKSHDTNIKKPTNNWVLTEIAKLDGAKTVRRHEKSTNIINWMGLSPRERRRVLKDKSSSDRWVGSCLNLVENKLDDYDDETNEVVQNDGIKVLVDVEVHVDVNKKSDNTALEVESPCVAVKSKVQVNKIKYPDDDCEEFQKNRGDDHVKLAVAPTIRLTPKKIKPAEITDPIETLESSNWIKETKDERVTSVYDYVLETPAFTTDVRNDWDAVDRLWMKNSIPFLRPSQWTAFAPITASPVSYHLSLGSIIEERQTWYKRFINFFNCCK